MFRVYSPCCSKRYVVYSVGSCVMLVVGWCSTQRTAVCFAAAIIYAHEHGNCGWLRVLKRILRTIIVTTNGGPYLKKGMTRTHQVGWLFRQVSKKGPKN